MRERRAWTDPAFVKSPRAEVHDEPRPDPLPASVVVLGALARYGLAAALAYFGVLKGTAAGAEAIEPFVRGSPTLSWLYAQFSVQDAARILGAVEIAAAVLIAARRISAVLCLLGSILAIAVFTTTVSFLFTTPGTFATIPGYPVPVPSAVGAFLLKDVFLLGIAVGSLAETIRALRKT